MKHSTTRLSGFTLENLGNIIDMLLIGFSHDY